MTNTPTNKDNSAKREPTYNPFAEQGRHHCPEHVHVVTDPFARIHHATGSARAGFDLTAFPSAKAFKYLLDRHDLGRRANYCRIRMIGDEDQDRYVYVWANADVLLITGNNPITGVNSEPGRREPQQGYASYIGIEGHEKAVTALYEDITETASYMKDRDPNHRSFV